MEITKVNYALVVYLALIEGLSLFVLDLFSGYPFDEFIGLLAGFIPALIVLSLYRIVSDKIPIKINGKEITKLPILQLSAMNALFIEILFIIQTFIPNPTHLFGYAVFGLLSVLLASLVLILAYNKLKLKVSFELNNKLIKVNKISPYASVYAGIFEFFILPLMMLFYSLNLFSLINGIVSGFVGGLIGLWIVNKILEKRPLELF